MKEDIMHYAIGMILVSGCAKLSDISKFITSEQDIDKDPSQCFPRCEMTDTIGVTEEKVFIIIISI